MIASIEYGNIPQNNIAQHSAVTWPMESTVDQSFITNNIPNNPSLCHAVT